MWIINARGKDTKKWQRAQMVKCQLTSLGAARALTCCRMHTHTCIWRGVKSSHPPTHCSGPVVSHSVMWISTNTVLLCLGYMLSSWFASAKNGEDLNVLVTSGQREQLLTRQLNLAHVWSHVCHVTHIVSHRQQGQVPLDFIAVESQSHVISKLLQVWVQG